MALVSGRRFNLALFGIGRIGSVHLKNMQRHSNINVLYLVDLDQERAIQLLARYKLDETKVLKPDESRAVFEDPRVDGVVICTPTSTHAKIAMEAIKAGKGVMCEKPLATTIELMLECYEEAKRQNVPLLCGFNRRFDPQLRDLHNKRGMIGRVESIKTCSRDADAPPLSYIEISGGIFRDSAIHDLDMVRWMSGEEPETIYSVAHAHIPGYAEANDVDTVYIILKFPSGVLAHIDLARHCSYGHHQTCEVFGENGNLVSGNQLISALHFDGARGIANDVVHHSFQERYAKAYMEEMAHFVDLLTGKTNRCRIAPSDTLRATFLAQAAEDSWRSGKVINLKDHFKVVFKGHCDNALLHE